MEEMKEKVVSAIRKELEDRLNDSIQVYNDALESRNSNTKSSAGDKYETSRAMMQQEMDNAEVRIHQLKKLQNELSRLPVLEVATNAIAGSLIQTDKGYYFLGLSAGKIMVDSQIIYAISTASPLGKLLLHKSVGEEIILNNVKQKILSLS